MQLTNDADGKEIYTSSNKLLKLHIGVYEIHLHK